MDSIGVSAQDIRRVEFRERLRGYHQGDVDEFLEKVATGIELLEEQLRSAGGPTAGERPPADPTVAAPAPVAEAPPWPAPVARGSGTPGSEQSLRRTLELAQRAADLAVQEAREQGAAIVATAEAEATTKVGDAEERARLLTEEAQREVRDEVARLEARRQELSVELDVLSAMVDQERQRARAWLAEVAAAVDHPVPSPTGSGSGSGSAMPSDPPPDPSSPGIVGSPGADD